jgi:hypothetical protein
MNYVYLEQDRTHSFECSKLVIQGLCGSGKSWTQMQKISAEINSPEFDHTTECFLWVCQSTKQAVDAKNRFTEKFNVNASIKVSQDTIDANPEFSQHLDTIFDDSAQIYIITTAAFILESYLSDLKYIHKTVKLAVIDEVELLNVVRPSLTTKNVSSLWVEQQSNDIEDAYKQRFSRNDLAKAKLLANNGNEYHFISECFTNSKFNLTILTTETLVTKVLKSAGFTVTRHVRDAELEKAFKTDYHIVFYHSNHIVSEYINTDEFKDKCKEYDNVIANKIEGSPNLYSSKGIDIIGNNLVVLRHLPKSYQENVISLLRNLQGFRMKEDEIIRLLYEDLLLQACGRSMGYRGAKRVSVITHTGVLSKFSLCQLPYNKAINLIVRIQVRGLTKRGNSVACQYEASPDSTNSRARETGATVD